MLIWRRMGKKRAEVIRRRKRRLLTPTRKLIDFLGGNQKKWAEVGREEEELNPSPLIYPSRDTTSPSKSSTKPKIGDKAPNFQPLSGNLNRPVA